MTRWTARLSLVAALYAAALGGCASMPFNVTKVFQSAADDELSSPMSLARLSERHGQIDYASQLYEAVLRKAPKNQMARIRLGVIAGRQGRFDEAQTHFDKAAALGADDSEFWNDRGYCYYLQERLSEAESALRTAVARDSTNKGAHNNLGLVLGMQRRFEESLAEFKAVSKDPEAQANLAYVKTQLGDFDGAQHDYHQALRMNAELRPAAEALLQLPQDGSARPIPAAPTYLARFPPVQTDSAVRQASYQEPNNPAGSEFGVADYRPAAESAQAPQGSPAASTAMAVPAPWQRPTWMPPSQQPPAR